MIYAKINADGTCAGFYDPAINKVPQGAVEITPEQHMEWLQKQHLAAWRDGKLVDVPAPAPAAPATPATPAARSPDELRAALQQLRDEILVLEDKLNTTPEAAT